MAPLGADCRLDLPRAARRGMVHSVRALLAPLLPTDDPGAFRPRSVAAITEALMAACGTADAVVAARAPIGLESPVFLILLVLLGLLTQAAWMHAT